MNVAIIGSGLIGNKRAEAVSKLKNLNLFSIIDIDISKAELLATKYQCLFSSNWRDIINSPDIDLIIIATQHDVAVEIAISALNNGKHILVEKPLGRNSIEAKEIIYASKKSCAHIFVGFNYRFYPHVMRAKELINSGYIGKVQYMKATLGHAARPNYDREWRVDPEKGGGGALLDPGVHIIDLARYLLEEELIVRSYNLQNAFWDIKFEDNAFVMSKTASGKTVVLHSSITSWKNTFSIEIMGTDGYLNLSGRGGFYGPMSISMNKRWAWLNKNEDSIEIQESFENTENSFFEELKNISDFLVFSKSDFSHSIPIHLNANGYDGLAAAYFIDEVYGKSQPSQLNKI
jgi:predicted dehydrogenase